ncbi:hypothetical protein CIL05_12290 [Virgibacillus profundi]|uniref:Uncharacterized protein n=1 Tax=Virgibacillus profundi TaxID=2024555 RepID=A0A2A2IDG2_9BACI|nr:hypothetical protein [Virgibacillus profundi]PAV29170.1 hypothetical protein CIL05_12290 [Virgibacillus profundi]PXY53339.1 hypothetical protein CIT14_12415 [Virgibacillus profundi]
MGYILPIEHYQYNDYQKRVIQEKRNPQFIERPFKVILEKQHQEIISEYDRLNGVPESKRYPVGLDALNAERYYGELTGKGQKFSESV